MQELTDSRQGECNRDAYISDWQWDGDGANFSGAGGADGGAAVPGREPRPVAGAERPGLGEASDAVRSGAFDADAGATAERWISGVGGGAPQKEPGGQRAAGGIHSGSLCADGGCAAAGEGTARGAEGVHAGAGLRGGAAAPGAERHRPVLPDGICG